MTGDDEEDRTELRPLDDVVKSGTGLFAAWDYADTGPSPNWEPLGLGDTHRPHGEPRSNPST